MTTRKGRATAGAVRTRSVHLETTGVYLSCSDGVLPCRELALVGGLAASPRALVNGVLFALYCSHAAMSMHFITRVTQHVMTSDNNRCTGESGSSRALEFRHCSNLVHKVILASDAYQYENMQRILMLPCSRDCFLGRETRTTGMAEV